MRRIHFDLGYFEMKIYIVAIGKVKEKYFTEAVEEYLKRCSRYADVSVVQLPEASPEKTPAEQRAIESASLLNKARGYVVALDMRGDLVASEDIAAMIAYKCGEGISEFSFLIGGSHGFDPIVRERADKVISFGRTTFPHQLFRVMLTEQIYRALTINAGTPYHK